MPATAVWERSLSDYFTGIEAMAKRAKKAQAKVAPADQWSVSIRMYRLGVGDCFLLRLRRKDKALPPYSVLIDCGIHQSTSGGTARIQAAASDIAAVTSGKLDLVVGTHEHWDHISGFQQASAVFGAMTADKAWLAWTEDDTDELAQKLALKEKRYNALALLAAADNQLRFAGNPPPAAFEALMGFFGPGGGVKLREAGEKLLALAGGKADYLKPGGKPIEIEDVSARVYVLGPPRDETLIGQSDPSRRNSEVYEFGRFAAAAADLERAQDVGGAPFDNRFAVPLAASRGLDFFARHYWSDHQSEPVSNPREEVRQDWRRIDSALGELAEYLALNLDEDTNNTSLVLAFELGDRPGEGPVLLFAADAQVGNWLGWKTLSWEAGGRTITSRDLLARTIVYKVAHHASHNATAKAEGLELMDGLELALVPTDDALAGKVGWGTLPWPALLKRLEEKAAAGVVRTDRKTGRALGRFKVTSTDLFYDVEF